MTIVSTVTFILSYLTIIGQVIVAVGIILLILNRGGRLLELVKNKAIVFSFIVALSATSGSLFFSEIAGFEACKMCWFQRIFMYPQVILLGIALLKKDYSIRVYSLVLSLIGAPIAAYHYLLQIGAAPALSCSTVGFSASCSQLFVLQFGYITIPMMAFTAFSLIIFFCSQSSRKII